MYERTYTHEMDHKEQSDDESDSVEEVITMRPIPVPRLPSFHRRSFERENFEKVLLNDSGLPTARDNTTPSAFESSSTSVFPPIISLNVGGHLYMTRLSTLLKYSDSMLASMFSGRHQIDKDKDGNFFLDSNGAVFGHILEYLRYGTIPSNDLTYLVFRDANYYGLYDLVEKLQLKPEISAVAVKEAQRAQFPNYYKVKDDVIKTAMSRAVINGTGDVYIYAFRKEFKPKIPNFNLKHGCVADNAQVVIGPWDTPADEDTFFRCLEHDLQEEGFTLRPHEGKKKCKYYFGQTCQKSVFKVTIIFG